MAAAQHDQRKAHAAARTRPSHEEVNKTRFQFAFSPYFASEVATYVPDGIACSKWTETSGFMCAGCAHVRPRGSLSICFFLTGKQMSVKVLLYLHAFQQIFFNTLGNNISNTHS